MCGNFNRGRRIPWPLKVAGALIFIPGLLILGTWVTMLLWNALMPVLFGLSVISFWQSMGILVLAKILFGGHHGGRGHFPRKPRFKDREAWKEHMRNKFADREFGGHGSRGRHRGRGPGGRWSEDNETDSESDSTGTRPDGDEPES
jgi:hypothetical protein